ncbi:SET domain-containing protein-lysine N-methyltransferase [Patescibacteria group bacterium]|nr:SET domain-containing protein-lysine N-methyltransferase [Patescibacteria group bacterium]MBP9710121.1 SET domain-containing protein-lysine N-methyltransferase [Patescibacteria group bacterium]
MKKENWISHKVEIRKAESEGEGMFANQLIQAGEEVVKFGGEYSNNHNEVEVARSAGKLIMQWDEELWSIEERGDGDDYFLNHSCDSNLWMKDAYTLIAKRDIQIGEELTADYAIWEADKTFVSKWECRCGSVECRGQVTGKDWRSSELQERYKDHFTPLLNKRIAKLKSNS